MQPTEDEAAHERGNEAAAAERSGDAVRQRSAGERDHLEPVLRHEPPRLGEAQDERSDGAGSDAADDAVADLLRHDACRCSATDHLLFRLCDGQRNEEQRHADAVVEPALDVQALADARGQTLVGDDRLPQRRIRRSEDDGQHERLGPRESREDGGRQRGSGGDGQRQPDAEQPNGQPDLLSQQAQVDA